MKLGAGRSKKEDNIDFEAGIYLNKTSNDYVNKNDVLFTLYSSNPIDSNLANDLLDKIEFSNKPFEIKEVLTKLN
ncbi:Pyrimidine-nucleoside phosphorylase [Mycoplasmopsis arginini]|nr:Pyrimidine-nucleoside phosphorylase [Chlamydia trachomatis]SGA02393.1 Pyrimidine-nucleoside phosphorylase [Chlamydia abortus]SGA05069.1 Pyrimidine-nucleoside phosphorylase [Mycoplasmopsis arginini]CRH46734.1 Pyrimidine-nucleoside phosphorylase [Chlamydia trachomatis]CRH55607.1 Pyrimidine-nucleoside phosphorylase [Chlamydia trachomatis]